MNKVEVFFYDNLCGWLQVDEYGTLIFEYDEHYLNQSFDAISSVLPLQKTPYYGGVAHAFFAGLLPEEEELKKVALSLGTDIFNTFRILKEIGKECIGAIRIGVIDQSNIPGYKAISKDELASLFNSQQSIVSQLIKNEKQRLSLAGAQSKIALLKVDDIYFIPQYGASSNVIIKPNSSNFVNMVENEFLTMQLAHSIGIEIPIIEILNLNDQLVYEIARFDRLKNGDKITRLHQEDFCQASGIMPQNKYEKDGGLSFNQCITLIRKECTLPALEINKFVELFLFNFIIGNRDAHCKNFSFLHLNGVKKLAPAYDLIATCYYGNLSDDMAMSINDVFDDELVTKADFEKMAIKAKLSPQLIINKAAILLQRIKVALNNLDLPENTGYSVTYKQLINERIEQVQKILDLI